MEVVYELDTWFKEMCMWTFALLDIFLLLLFAYVCILIHPRSHPKCKRNNWISLYGALDAKCNEGFGNYPSPIIKSFSSSLKFDCFQSNLSCLSSIESRFLFIRNSFFLFKRVLISMGIKKCSFSFFIFNFSWNVLVSHCGYR